MRRNQLTLLCFPTLVFDRDGLPLLGRQLDQEPDRGGVIRRVRSPNLVTASGAVARRHEIQFSICCSRRIVASTPASGSIGLGRRFTARIPGRPPARAWRARRTSEAVRAARVSPAAPTRPRCPAASDRRHKYWVSPLPPRPPYSQPARYRQANGALL